MVIEIINEWRCTSTRFICRRTVDRDKFTLPLLLGNNSDEWLLRIIKWQWKKLTF
jgi:hypothetical protein